MARRSNNGNGKRGGRRTAFGASGSGSATSTPTGSEANFAGLFSLNPQLLADTASYSYNSPLGNRVGPLNASSPYSGGEMTYFPGVCALYMACTPGLSGDGSSPINTAANNLYSYVRHANSGARNYDAPDLMLYMMGVSELHKFHHCLVRLYGLLNIRSQVNRYYPEAFFDAHGVDYLDLATQMADFRAYINWFAVQIGSMCIPASIPYTKWMTEFFDHVYQDAEDVKSQTYIHIPDRFYLYEGFASDRGGQLVPTALFAPKLAAADRSKFIKLKDLQSFGRAMISKIVPDEDCGTMSGDILKAFGADNVWKTFMIPEDYSVFPIYSDRVLNMINNTTAADWFAQPTGGAFDSSYNIISDANTVEIIYAPVLDTSRMLVPEAGFWGGSVPVNLFWDSPTPEDTMVAIQSTVRLASVQLSSDKGSITSLSTSFLPTMLCTGVYVLTAVQGYPTYPCSVTPVMHITCPSTSVVDSTAQAIGIARLTNFKAFPITIVASDEIADTYYSQVAYAGDIQNYTLMSAYDLEKMHYSALLSLFNVPQMGSYNITR